MWLWVWVRVVWVWVRVDVAPTRASQSPSWAMGLPSSADVACPWIWPLGPHAVDREREKERERELRESQPRHGGGRSRTREQLLVLAATGRAAKAEKRLRKVVLEQSNALSQFSQNLELCRQRELPETMGSGNPFLLFPLTLSYTVRARLRRAICGACMHACMVHIF